MTMIIVLIMFPATTRSVKRGPLMARIIQKKIRTDKRITEPSRKNL